MTRPLPRSLAPLAEDLELDAVVVATTQDLLRRAERLGIKAPSVAITRLAKHGWLLKTGVAGAWEFAPAAHAGPYSRGDPFMVLRAQLAVAPATPVRVALGSALWLQGITDRPPDRHEVSLPPTVRVPVALRRAYRVSQFLPELPAVGGKGIPVNGAASTLVHIAHKPSDVRSWGAVLEALGDLVAAVTWEDLEREVEHRPTATKVRLAYLIAEIAPQLVERLEVIPSSVVWFGGRGPLRRYDARWNVADTVLPWHPAHR